MCVFDRAARLRADAAADNEVDALFLQAARGLVVVGIVKTDLFLFNGLDVLDAVDVKLLSAAEVLQHLAVLAGNGNLHGISFPFRSIAFGGRAAASCYFVVYHALPRRTTGNL